MHSIDAAYRYRWTGVVYPSVRPSVRVCWHDREVCRNGQTSRDAVWGRQTRVSPRECTLAIDMCDGGDASCCYRYCCNLSDSSSSGVIKSIYFTVS